MLRLTPLLLVACTQRVPSPDVPDPLDIEDPPCPELQVWHLDHDEDGFGDLAKTKEACSRPFGYTADATDCDDDDAGTYPGAIEVCDGVDRDCDGIVDGPNSVDATGWHPDADGDGYGDAITAVYACERPEGLSRDRRDCDDADPDVHPGASDPACDGIDQDCAGALDTEAAQIRGQVFDTLAIALEAVHDGDVVYACAGVHPVSTRIEGDLHLVGVATDPGQVVLDGGSARRILDVDGDALTLENLTLRNGAAQTGDGGALRAVVRRLHVERVVFTGNRAATDGGALSARLDGDAIDATLTGVVFEGNHAADDGGAAAIHLARSDYVTLEDAVFRDNTAGGSGGGIRLTGGENTAVISARDVLALDHTAGMDGGWLSARSFQHVIVRLNDVDVRRASAGQRGGLIALDAPGDAKLDITNGTLSAGAAGVAGGLIAHRGDFTLDLKLHGVDLESGTAPVGGLARVQTGGTGHLDWLDATLHHGEASAGSALYLTGSSTGFTGTMARVGVYRNRGGPALQVDPDMVLVGTAGFAMTLGSVVDNEAGGVSVPSAFDVDTTLTDLGTGTDDNGPFDVRVAGEAYRWDGAVSVHCEDGVCETKE